MVHSNNRNMHGFSFIEVILAITLIGAVITPALVVQYNILGFLTRSSDTIRSVFLLDALYSWAVLEEKKEEDVKKLEKKYKDPELATVYEVTELPKKSPLKNMKHLMTARTSGTWQRGSTTQRQQELSFIFSPPQEKKEEAPEGKKKGKEGKEKTAPGPEKAPAKAGADGKQVNSNDE